MRDPIYQNVLRYRRKTLVLLFAELACVLACSAVALCIALGIIDACVAVSYYHAYFLFAAFGALFLIALAFVIHNRKRVFMPFLLSAKDVDAKAGFDYALVSYFELMHADDALSVQFVKSFEKENARNPFTPFAKSDALRVLAPVAIGITAAVIAACFVFSSAALRAAKRYYYALPFVENPDIVFEIDAASAVLRYADVPITVITDAEAAYIRVQNGASVPMEKTARGYTHTMFRAKESFSFRITLYKGHARDERRRAVGVYDIPYIAEFKTRITPPGRAKAYTLTNDGEIAALKGTVAHIEARANNPLKNVWFLRIENGITNHIPLVPSGTAFRHSITVRSDFEYAFALVDVYGCSNDAFPVYRVTAESDYPPFVEIISPKEDVIMYTSKAVPVYYRAGDDYGLRALSFIADAYDDNGARVERSYTNALALGRDRTIAQGGVPFDYRALSPLPGYTIRYRIEAEDDYGGRSVSEERSIVIPDMAMMLTATAEERANAEEALSRVKEDHDALLKESERLLRETRRERDLGANAEKADTARKAEEMKRQTETMKERVDETRKRLTETIHAAEANAFFDAEAIAKLKDIERALKELSEETLMRMQSAFERVMNDIPIDEKERELFKANTNAQEFKERLARTLEALEAIKNAERMSAIATEARALLEEQEALNDVLMRNGAFSEAERERERMAATRLQTLAEGVKSNAFNLSSDTYEKTKAALAETGVETAAGTLKELSESRTPSMANAGDALSKMRAFAKAMEETLDRLRGEDAHAAMRAVNEALFHMQYIGYRVAEMYASLERYAKGASADNNARNALPIARELSHYRVVYGTLDELLTEALRAQVSGIERLSAGFAALKRGTDAFARALDNKAASRAMLYALEALAKENASITYTLLRLRDEMTANNESASGSRMNAAAQRQESLNERTKNLFGKSSEARAMDERMKEYMKQLALEQETIQNALRALREGRADDALKQRGEGERANGAGDVSRESGFGDTAKRDEEAARAMEAQIEEIRKDMQTLAERGYDEKTFRRLMERQSEVLKRMLAHTKGLQTTKEKEDAYEGEGAKNADAFERPFIDPALFQTSEETRRIEEALKRRDLPPEYRKEIEAYLKALKGK